MANNVVFLSAGHGGKDPGAVAYGLREKDINLQIMLACKAELDRHAGVDVVCSRVKDEDDPVTEEVREANACDADVAVDFHNNAGGGDGSETLYYPSSADSKRLAELFEKYTKELGQNSRGIKPRKDLWFLRGTNMPAVIAESAFVDNDKDNDIIDTLKEQQAFGKAYAKAILEYLEIEYKSTAVQKPEATTAKVDFAKSFNKAYAKTYKVNSEDGLKLRCGAGTDKDLIVDMPMGSRVRCYGYYTKASNGTVWVLVTYGNYKGFCSLPYLK